MYIHTAPDLDSSVSSSFRLCGAGLFHRTISCKHEMSVSVRMNKWPAQSHVLRQTSEQTELLQH